MSTQVPRTIGALHHFMKDSAQKTTIRQRAGAILLDLPRFARTVLLPRPLGGDWTHYRNREDQLSYRPSGRGVRCDWEYTRRLHLCRVFPWTSRQLLKTALAEWPVRFAHGPVTGKGSPRITFAIGHRGEARLPHLLWTLQSIAAQRDVEVECIVVEQDVVSRIRPRLPAWVKHVFTPISGADTPFNRSWAFNVAAHEATTGSLLVFHDHDMLVPESYAAELVRLHREGYAVINAKRFVFYLVPDVEASARAIGEGSTWPVEQVIENLEAGGSVAIAPAAFSAIGGFDERFVGWGGEDNEFWDRCLVLKVWNGGYLPIVHLWHQGQPGKRALHGAGAGTASYYQTRRAIPREERIRELCGRSRGSPAGAETARSLTAHGAGGERP